jgi:hypothetical protein
MCSYRAFCIAMAVMFVCFAVAAQADTITLVNPDFEQPNVGKITTGFDDPAKDVPGWSNAATGTFTDTGIDYPDFHHTGSYSGYMRAGDPGGGGMYQVSNHTIAAGETFSLAWWQYRDGNLGTALASIFYIDGTGTSQLLGSMTAYPDAKQTWQQYTLSNVAATSGSVGYNVAIGFKSLESWSTIDDVALSYTGIPEPAVSVLLATGLMGLLAYAWRRRR